LFFSLFVPFRRETAATASPIGLISVVLVSPGSRNFRVDGLERIPAPGLIGPADCGIEFGHLSDKRDAAEESAKRMTRWQPT
jgi:hypothetical protein